MYLAYVTEGKRKAYAMIMLKQMMLERCSNDVLLHAKTFLCHSGALAIESPSTPN